MRNSISPVDVEEMEFLRNCEALDFDRERFGDKSAAEDSTEELSIKFDTDALFRSLSLRLRYMFQSCDEIN